MKDQLRPSSGSKKLRSVKLLHASELFVTLAFVSVIAGVTYLGFRPDRTSAETKPTISTAASSVNESGGAGAFESSATAENSTPTLQIDSISLTTPVLTVEPDDQTLKAPDYLAGVYYASENKTFIIGHSSTVFKNLHHLTIGATILFDHAEYTVSNLTIRKKEDISMKNLLKSESEPLLVLMTCYGEPLGGQDYSHRLIVTAKRSL